MLPLDSSEWDRLHDIYGPASKIPDLLRRVAENPGPVADYRDEPWCSLWSALCHQGDASSASYAAVPHFVAIALATKGPITDDLFFLPASIEIARVRKRGPDISEELAPAYFEAINALPKCAFAHSADAWDLSMTQSVVTAIAAAKGQIDLAEALANLTPDLIERIVADDLD